MKKTINFHEFSEGFRAIRPDNFTYEGLRALFDYLENYEEEMGEKIEFDVIALCCDYSEYSDIEEFQHNYGEEYETIEDIEERTTVIRIDNDSFIIQGF